MFVVVVVGGEDGSAVYYKVAAESKRRKRKGDIGEHSSNEKTAIYGEKAVSRAAATAPG
jgi:hypothetical protein